MSTEATKPSAHWPVIPRSHGPRQRVMILFFFADRLRQGDFKMMWQHGILHRLPSTSTRGRRSTLHRTCRNRRRPALEHLEGRALLTAGVLDPSFGAGAGYVTTDLGTPNDGARVVAVQPWDGKIVVAANYDPKGSGPYESSPANFALIRYNADGSLDTTFGTNGVVETDFYGGQDDINAIVFTADHKIDAVGQAYYAKGKNAGEQIGVARYNTNGTLDTTFGSGGKVTIAASTSYKYNANEGISAFLDPAGDLVILGSWQGTKWGSIYTPPFYGGSSMVRLSTNGSLDTSFGNGGIVTTTAGWNAFRLQPTGSTYKIDVVGTDSNGKEALLQFNANGSADGTFGNKGEVVLGGGGFSNQNWIAFEPDGGFVGVSSNTYNVFTITRYSAAGSVVFENVVNVTALLPPGTYPAGFDLQTLAVDPSGRILLGGGVFDNSYGGNTNSALLRLDSSGNLDTTFGNGGLVVQPVGPYDGEFNSLTFQADGSIIAGGFVDVDPSGPNHNVLVTRFESA